VLKDVPKKLEGLNMIKTNRVFKEASFEFIVNDDVTLFVAIA